MGQSAEKHEPIPAPVVKWGWAAGAGSMACSQPCCQLCTNTCGVTHRPASVASSTWLAKSWIFSPSRRTHLDSLIENTVWKISHSHSLFSHSHWNYFLCNKWTSPVHSLRHEWNQLHSCKTFNTSRCWKWYFLLRLHILKGASLVGC